MARTSPAMTKKHSRDIYCEGALPILPGHHEDQGKRLSGKADAPCCVPMHHTADPHAFVIKPPQVEPHNCQQRARGSELIVRSELCCHSDRGPRLGGRGLFSNEEQSDV